MKKTLLLGFSALSFMSTAQRLTVSDAGRYSDGRTAACEISTYDATNKRLFVTNAASDSIDIIDLTILNSPQKIGGINVLNYGGGINSVVNLKNGYFAAAIEAPIKQNPGKIVFFDMDGMFISELEVGSLPDMVTVTKDGTKVLVANEGEPNDDYTIDPDGSVSIIDISVGIPNLTQANVTNLTFEFAPEAIQGGLKKPGSTMAQELEPEYIAVNDNSDKAIVTCQESNVFVLIDLEFNTIIGYKGLGFKDHSIIGQGLDASNSDDSLNIQNWNVKGVYQPDAVSSFDFNNSTFWITANEGDGRDYSGYSSETRIKDLTLDPTVFPDAATLQLNENLGRLKTFTIDMIGDTDGDGDVDELYSYGGRSFSIWNENGNLIWDSGDQIEQYIKAHHPDFFNCDEGLAAEYDSRSDDKGPEPEAVTVGKVAGHLFAFIGLERQGGLMIYDITDPYNPVFDQFINTYQADGTSMDAGPEGILFIPASESHTGENLLILSNEVSGTTSLLNIEDATAGFSELVEQQFSIYPNPTSTILHIDFEEFNSETNFQITSVNGEIVMNGLLENQSNEVNISELKNGIYFINVLLNNQMTKTERIVKQ